MSERRTIFCFGKRICQILNALLSTGNFFVNKSHMSKVFVVCLLCLSTTTIPQSPPKQKQFFLPSGVSGIMKASSSRLSHADFAAMYCLLDSRAWAI